MGLLRIDEGCLLKRPEDRRLPGGVREERAVPREEEEERVAAMVPKQCVWAGSGWRKKSFVARARKSGYDVIYEHHERANLTFCRNFYGLLWCPR
jgi:hypothetical protein